MSPMKIDGFEKINEITRGSYADVYKVRAKARVEEQGSSTVTDLICAAKFIKLPVQQHSNKSPDLQQLVKENKDLCSLSHRNLMKLYDMKAMLAESAIAMFMELFEGRELARLIQSSGALNEAKIRTISIQVCNALEYLHTNDIIHRNINSGTVMVAEDNVVKLVDFGLSIQLLDATSYHSLGQPRGHPHYMAPEVFLSEEAEKSESGCIYSRGSDIWAFGCVVYEMATGKTPYADCKNMLAIVHEVKGGSQSDLPDQCSEDLKSFYAGCMVRNRRERMPVTNLLGHEFLLSRSDKEKSAFATEGLNGLCLVISTDSDETASQNSTNTKQDADQIERVFTSLGYEVKTLKNADSNELWNSLHDLVTNQVTTKCGCLVCFILAPGENGMVISKDGSEIEIRDVVGKFLSTQCPNLKAKPKLFFVQSECSMMTQTDNEDDFSFRLREKDFLVCNVALGKDGASFVEMLCNVLESQQFKDKEVESILGEVTQRLKIDAPIRKEQRFCTSSPEIVSSLSMRCFLNFSSNTSKLCQTLPKDWSNEQLKAEIDCLTEVNKRFGPMKQTLLILAAIRGRADFVKILLQKVPSDIGVQDVRGRTALCWAAHKGHENVLTELKSALGSETLTSEVNRADFAKQTPTMLAAKRHREATMLDKLHEMGANLDSVDTVKFTAVTYAAKQGFADTVEQLLKLRANAKLLDLVENSPLVWAARNGHADVVKVFGKYLLTETDASYWKLKGERGMDAEQWAEFRGHRELAGWISQFIRQLPRPVLEPQASNDSPNGRSNRDGDNNDDRNRGSQSGSAGAYGGGGNGSSGGAGGSGGSQSGGNGGDGSGDDSNRRPNRPGGPSHQAASRDRYPMKEPPKGLAFILDNAQFNCAEQRNRLWSIEQIDALIVRFYLLGFHCRVYRDNPITLFETLQALFAENNGYRNSDSLLLCILSNGQNGLVYDCDGREVSLEKVFCQFKTCNILKSKPKIFIVQAGREIPNERFAPRQAGRLCSSDQKDCLYAFSCVNGGSSDPVDVPPKDLFIQALEAALQDHNPETEEFVSVLPRVNQMVAHDSGGRQVSCFESTLERKLYFWPT